MNINATSISVGNVTKATLGVFGVIALILGVGGQIGSINAAAKANSDNHLEFKDEVGKDISEIQSDIEDIEEDLELSATTVNETNITVNSNTKDIEYIKGAVKDNKALLMEILMNVERR